MVNTNYLKFGQMLYLVSPVGIEKVESDFNSVLSCNHTDKDYIKVYHKGTVDYNGNEICPTYGESEARCSDLFLTLEEAVASIKKEENDRFKRYKESIKTVKDLIEFPIKNSFSDYDGCQDGLIVRAYKERAEELLGFHIENY